MYVASSYAQNGDKAAIGTEFMYKPFDGHCMKFWYHMFGEGQGILNVWTHEVYLHIFYNSHFKTIRVKFILIFC